MNSQQGKAPRKPRNPLGKLGPWSWALEPVRGCNLRCGHCATRLFEKGHLEFMTEETWRALFSTIAAVSPATRVEMAQAGEPTLHPRLLEFIKIARQLSPHSQIQVTTNGTRLIDGSLTYRELFAAGANIIYTDMYAPRAAHVKLAEGSGVEWYAYHEKEWKERQDNLFATEHLATSSGGERPNCWTYHGPHLKLVVLMENPAQWPEKRKNLNRLGTFFNHLDWKASQRFGLTPVTKAPQARCAQPFKYVVVHVKGTYVLCCQDFMAETSGLIGSVHEGPEGFMRFWFGPFMQGHRRGLRKKDRAGSPYCSRCSITFAGTDRTMWPEESVQGYWDGERWRPLDEGADGVEESAMPPRDILTRHARVGTASAADLIQIGSVRQQDQRELGDQFVSEAQDAR